MTAKGKQWALRDLRLEEVRERPDFQLRANGINSAHAKRLLRALQDVKELGPVKVAQIGKALYLVDGFHRLDAHKLARRQTISAEVARMSLEEARAEAQQANTTHGLNLNRKDKLRVWADYIASGRHLDDAGALKSSRVIATELDQVYSRETIRQKLKAMGMELNEGEDFKAWGGDEVDEDTLAEERADEAENLLAHLAAVLPTLNPGDLQRLTGATRALLDAAERGEDAKGLLEAIRNPLGI